MNKENIKYENKEICAKCGGYCCKKSGCDFSTKDFESLKIDYLQEKLEEGHISIVSVQNFQKINNGKILNEPFLYLRARNINRPIVDLLSFKTTCASLQSDGCTFDINNRPTGGVNLIPVENGVCYPLESHINIVYTWKDYQKILHRLVKRITGKSVDENLRIDVENLFYDYLSKNFAGVMDIEIEDVESMLTILQCAYSDEYNRARKRYEDNVVLKLKSKK